MNGHSNGHHHANGHSNGYDEKPVAYDEKGGVTGAGFVGDTPPEDIVQSANVNKLQRRLEGRHMQMIAIGKTLHSNFVASPLRTF